MPLTHRRLSLTHILFFICLFFFQQGAAYLRPTVPVRTLWNSWKSGFSSSSAAQEGGKEDGKNEKPPTEVGSGAATAEATGAEAGASAEQETQQEYTTEELQAALNECVENLEAEKKKVRTKILRIRTLFYGGQLFVYFSQPFFRSIYLLLIPKTSCFET